MRLIALLFLFVSAVNAQVTIRITSIPANTPVGATIYFAGTANGWNAGSAAHIMQPDGLGAYVITIPEATGVSEYKFTRGSWAAVEGNASGGFLPNRSFTFTGSPQTINVAVQSWEDIAGSGTGSTAASNVQVLSTGFYMPQLDRYRRIWIYLPPDYFTTAKYYPVLYMQDGQNLFDDATSFSGEWHVDETLNTLHASGDFGAIVIGIDNGGALRLDEYSPWNNPAYGGGEGDLYMQFVAETLKPYIDANFRTRSEPQFNALIGSSMGAFISTYGAVKYPQGFSKIGIFSPAFWFAMPQMSSYITTSANDLTGLRMYFVAGQNESASMVPNINTIKANFMSKGVTADNIFTKIDLTGTHTESYWSGEFAAAYQWLFQNEVLAAPSFSASALSVYQDPQGQIIAEGLDQEMAFKMYSMQGVKIAEVTLRNGINELPGNLAAGIYILKNALQTVKVFKK